MTLAEALPRAGWRASGAAFVAGLLAAFGLAPFDLWGLGLMGFGIGIALVSHADRPGQLAWVWGFGYFALALHWIVEPFFVDAPRHGWLAPFGLVFLAGGMALFWGVAGWLSGRLRFGVLQPLGVALCLCLLEMVRAYLLSGFPWAHPGHILIDTIFLQVAGLIGPHGLTLMVLLSAALLVMAPEGRRGFAILLAWSVAAIGLSLIAARPAPPVPEDAPVVRLIQPNAPQDQKWEPQMIPVFFDRGLELTRGGGADLIVWPETSLPVLLEDSARWRAEIAQAAGGAPAIVGVQRFPERRARNALVLLDPGGEIAAIYDKHRLVPFGEYIPIRALTAYAGIEGIAAYANGGFWPGEGPMVLDLGPELGMVFPMICYEAIFPQYLRQVERPDWQLHLTNDAWFGNLAGPYQHLALARLRAAESGLPLLRAANTGVSAVIDGRGQIVDSLPLNRAGALDVRLPPALPPTLYVRLGDWPVAVISLFSLLAVFGVLRARKR